MKELTRAEEQVMQILWKIRKGFVSDILDRFEEPKPAYNTISTIIRILEKKGFVSHQAFGKSHEYYPLVTKKEYTGRYFSNIMKNYFSNSYEALVSFLANDKGISIGELEEIRQLVEKEIEKQSSRRHE